MLKCSNSFHLFYLTVWREEEVRVPLWKASDESSSSMIKIMYNCVFCTAWRERGGEEGQMIDG
jgi:hypothetical protein